MGARRGSRARSDGVRTSPAIEQLPRNDPALRSRDTPAVTNRSRVAVNSELVTISFPTSRLATIRPESKGSLPTTPFLDNFRVADHPPQSLVAISSSCENGLSWILLPVPFKSTVANDSETTEPRCLPDPGSSCGTDVIGALAKACGSPAPIWPNETFQRRTRQIPPAQV